MGFDHPKPMGGYAQGGTLAAPIFKQWAQVAYKDAPVIPFRAPAGIRLVRIDRRSGQKVFGAWPTDDPKAAVIWEAFKPESEPRRSLRREELLGTADGAPPAAAAKPRVRRPAAAAAAAASNAAAPAPATTPPPAPPPSNGLQDQGPIH
jgi:penicillin-binding protein 1A